jgi:diguanylate cyclase (GGDEF)-like protein
MSTLTKIKENPGPIRQLIDYKELDFSDFKEYEYYRLVNPIDKVVYDFKDGKLELISDENCFDIWDNGEPCKYCVSANALANKCEKKKLEYLEGELQMAKVIPVVIEGKELVLELFQNLSDTYLKIEQSFTQLSTLIRDFNNLASLDSFTNLYSHSYTLDKLKTIISKKIKNVETVSLVVADINKLKYVNDTFGHVVGDELILKVAQILEPLKKMDNVFPGRTGGDEFQIILLNMNEEQSNALLQNVFKKLASIQLEKADYIASVSYALLEWNKDEKAEGLINRVDKLMYINKKKSR